MMAIILKIFLLYIAYVMIKNVFKGFLTYRAFKNDAQQFYEKARQAQGATTARGDVFEAEYRVVKEDSPS